MLSETYNNIPKLFMKEEYDVAPIASKILQLDDFLMTEIYRVNNGMINETEMKEYIPHLLETIGSVKDKNIYYSLLANSKHIDKKELIEFANKLPDNDMRYALLQRDDLTKKDVSQILNYCQPHRLHEFLADGTSYIYPNNLDLMCKLSQAELKKIRYLCFSRITPATSDVFNILDIL